METISQPAQVVDSVQESPSAFQEDAVPVETGMPASESAAPTPTYTVLDYMDE